MLLLNYDNLSEQLIISGGLSKVDPKIATQYDWSNFTELNQIFK